MIFQMGITSELMERFFTFVKHQARFDGRNTETDFTRRRVVVTYAFGKLLSILAIGESFKPSPLHHFNGLQSLFLIRVHMGSLYRARRKENQS